MSWSIVNEILGLAIVDPAFRRKLLSSPLSTVQEQGFVLTSEEVHVIQHIHAHNLADFSQHIIDNLCPDKDGKESNLSWRVFDECVFSRKR